MRAKWANSDDPVVQQLVKLRIPVTRDSYLELAYFGEVPDLGAEQEAELPRQLQRLGRSRWTAH